jgi:hypothetical protein
MSQINPSSGGEYYRDEQGVLHEGTPPIPAPVIEAPAIAAPAPKAVPITKEQ